jgi:WD40 repeat protein
MKYVAFISYKHAASSAFAVALESALKRYAKPMFRLPPKIFRDEKHLVPGQNLPKLLADALAESQYLILLASPEAAQSVWVSDELRRWCGELGRAENLIIILTDGTIELAQEQRRLDWAKTTALPSVLRDYLDSAPLYMDLRECRTSEAQSLRDATFLRAVNAISAKLRGVDPNDLAGEEVKIYRRNRALRNWAIGLLATFGIIASVTAGWAVYQGQIAEQRRKEAVEQRQLAVSRLLAAQSDLARGRSAQSAELSLLLAAEGLRRLPTAEGDEALRVSLSSIRRAPLWQHSAGAISEFAFDEQGSALATLSSSGIEVRDTTDGHLIGTVVADGSGMVLGKSGAMLALRSSAREAEETETVTVWRVKDGAKIVDIPVTGDFDAVVFGPSGQVVVASRAGGSDEQASVVALWDLDARHKVYDLRRTADVRVLGFSEEHRGLLLLNLGPDRNQSILELVSLSEDATLARLEMTETVTPAAFDGDSHIAIVPRTFFVDGVTEGDHIRVLSIGQSQDGSGLEIAAYPTELFNISPVSGLRFAGKDGKLLSESEDGMLRLWQLAGDQASLLSTVALPSDRFNFSGLRPTVGPTATHMAFVDETNSLCVDRIAPNKRTFLLQPPSSISGMAFDERERRLVVVGYDGQISAWDTDSEAYLAKVDGVESLLAMSPDGATLVMRGEGTLVVRRAEGQGAAYSVPHEGTPRAVAFTGDGTRFVTVSAAGVRGGSSGIQAIGDDDIHVWRASDGQEATRWNPAGSRWSALSPDASLLAFVGDDNVIRIAEAGSGAVVREIRPSSKVFDLAFDPSTTYLAVVSPETVEVWDLHSEAVVGPLRLGFKVDHYDVIGGFARGGRRIIIDGVPWDLEKRTRMVEEVVEEATFSGDGRLLALGFGDGTIRVMDLETGSIGSTLQQYSRPKILSFSSDARYLVGAGDDRYVRVWDLAQQAEVVRIEQPGTVWQALFGPGDRFLATMVEGSGVHLWAWRPADLLAEAQARTTRNLSKAEWHSYFPGEPYRRTFESLPDGD